MFPIHDDNPTPVVPYVTYALIASCIGIFAYQFLQGDAGQLDMVYSYGMIPAAFFGHAELASEFVRVPAHATIFTSMFLHGGFMHLAGNMLYLWVFGNNIEAAMGHVKFICFYLLTGVVAALSHALPDMNSQIPMIGASGAISGVLGAYLLLYPQARVLILIPIFFIIKTVRVPAMLVLVIWFLMQLISSVTAGDSEGGGVAFGAHIGGFIAGMVFVTFFKYSNVPLQIPFLHFDPFERFRKGPR